MSIAAGTAVLNGTGKGQYFTPSDYQAAIEAMIGAFKSECDDIFFGSADDDISLPTAFMFSRAWVCRCTKRCPCRFTQSNGIVRTVLQCVACGKKEMGGVRNADYPEFDQLPFYDEALEGERRAAFTEAIEQMQAYREYIGQRSYNRKNRDWWEQYSAYLKSPEWKDKRRRVLDRDKRTCQACLLRKATQVHHLTYEHVFNEPLFELIAVCDICHRALHVEAEV